MMMMMMNTQWWASRAQLRATLSTVIISSLLFSLAERAHSAVPRLSDCEPRHCGKGPNISYPFRIDDGKQPDYCGYPGFEVSCQDDEPVIKPSNERFVVQEIFNENMSVIVSDVEFHNSSCPYPRYNLDLAITAFNFSPINRELFFYLNCTERSPELFMLECAENSKDKFSFVTDRPVPSNESCESMFVTRVLADGAIDARSYVSALRKGFLLEWKAPHCSVCQTSGGRCGFNHTSNQVMCICSERVHLVDCVGAPILPGFRQESKRKIILGITTGGSGFLLACIILCCCRCKKNSNACPLWAMKSRDSHNIEAFLEQYGSTVPKRYRYPEVKKMTKSFSDKLGQGGFGAVFKGKLPDGRLVAVKVLNKSNENVEDFINEVASIGRTQHVNIVRLLGFCYERSKRALLYEFMPNGSLEKFIFSTKQSDTTLLGWEKLLEISIGIARGLEYLHRGCNTRIVHFDIKPHNILLDEDFCPKISDFGLAKTCHPKQSVLSRVDTRGTIGYIAPEVFSRKFGVISSKSDVYSYGMMVLEMVGGRNNVDTGMDNTSEIYFPHWIYEHFNEDDGLKFRDITSETEEVAGKMVLVGLWCIQTSPSGRPSMTKVVEMLEGKSEDVSMPPKPYLCSP